MEAILQEAISRWRDWIAKCVQVLLIASSFCVHGGCEQEATYQGNTVSAWASALRSDNPGLRQQAADALVAIGPPAVWHLIKVVEDPNASVTTRCIAIESIGRLGPQATDAVPALSNALSDPDRRVCIRAVRAVGQMGPAGKKAAGGLIAAARRAADNIDEELMAELESTAARIGVHIR